jgi:purine-nucleoside phosphorylase
MTTPHLSAEVGAFAETVLLPGDPRRAWHIAEHHLDGAELVNEVRGALAYTGTHDGVRISVLGTGMGIPSASIYATELARVHGVRRMVRVGSCGALGAGPGLRGLVLAAGACTDSGVNRTRYDGMDFAAIADFGLLRATADAAASHGSEVAVGNVHSADLFYDPRPGLVEVLAGMGVLAVEMEAAGLYGVAAAHGVAALAVLTVSDELRSGEHTTPDERERGFDAMVEVALAGVHGHLAAAADGDRDR